METRARLSVALAVAVSSIAVTAAAQEKGLHLQHVSSPAPGRLRAFVAPDATIGLGSKLENNEFAVILPGGRARDVDVKRNGTRGGMTTIVLLDISGSYIGKDGAGRTVAFPTIKRYLSHLSFPADQIALFPFEADAQPSGFHHDPAPFLKEVERAERQKAKGRTNLIAGLRAALKEAPEAPGLVEVVIFTDAGDEANDTKKGWEEVVEESVRRGIRFDVVTIKATPKDFRDGDKPSAWLASHNHLAELSNRTHGRFVDDVADPAQVDTLLEKSRSDSQGWLVVEAKLCGAGATGDIDARVEYAPGGGATTGYTRTEKFSPQLDADSKTACEGIVCLPTCPSWQACTNKSCGPKQCSAPENCAPDGVCGADKLCAPVPQSRSWIWALAAGGLLLLVLGIFALTRRTKATPIEQPAIVDVTPPPVAMVVEPVPAAEPPPAVESEPIAEPVSAPAIQAQNALEHLPETHLVAVGGEITHGEKWRLHKRKMQVGGSSDPADGNDIVFAVAKVSGRHAQFDLYPSGDLWVTDLGSSNGTFVDGRRITQGERVKLQAGTQVKVSQQVILEVVRPGVQVAPPILSTSKEPEPEAPKLPSSKGRTVFDPGNR